MADRATVTKQRVRKRGPVDPQLNGGARRNLMRQLRATQPNCYWCGYPIDLRLDRQRHPLASCGDELIPRIHGGSATDPNNVVHAHRLCNGVRLTAPDTPDVRQRCRNAVERHLHARDARNEW